MILEDLFYIILNIFDSWPTATLNSDNDEALLTVASLADWICCLQAELQMVDRLTDNCISALQPLWYGFDVFVRLDAICNIQP